jgi:Domain of unknown function (DUF6484)
MNDFRAEDEIAEPALSTERSEPVAALPLTTTVAASIHGAIVGVLVGFKDDSRTPLVMYPGQPGTAALPARMVPDIHGPHIGRQVVLMFNEGDPRQPIVMGCLRPQESWTMEKPGQVEVDADGERLIVTAKDRLVLRCGKASITLTKEGKVLVEGTYLLRRQPDQGRLGAAELILASPWS